MGAKASGAAMNCMGQSVQATPQLYAQILSKQKEMLQQAVAHISNAVANSGNERTIFSSPAATTIRKRRGRPSKADIERKQKEAIERGDNIPPALGLQSQVETSRQDDIKGRRGRGAP